MADDLVGPGAIRQVDWRERTIFTGGLLQHGLLPRQKENGKLKWLLQAPAGANQMNVRLATQVQARTQQRAAATGQFNHCLLVVTHGRNLAGSCGRLQEDYGQSAMQPALIP
jgi:hypothetical protein